MSINSIMFNRILKGGVVIPLIFPKVPQSSLGILRVPRLHPPLEHPLVKVNYLQPLRISSKIEALSPGVLSINQETKSHVSFHQRNHRALRDYFQPQIVIPPKKNNHDPSIRPAISLGSQVGIGLVPFRFPWICVDV